MQQRYLARIPRKGELPRMVAGRIESAEREARNEARRSDLLARQSEIEQRLAAFDAFAEVGEVVHAQAEAAAVALLISRIRTVAGSSAANELEGIRAEMSQYIRHCGAEIRGIEQNELPLLESKLRDVNPDPREVHKLGGGDRDAYFARLREQKALAEARIAELRQEMADALENLRLAFPDEFEREKPVASPEPVKVKTGGGNPFISGRLSLGNTGARRT